MENHNHVPTTVLNVENVCCKAFRKKLKKELHKIPGVNSVAIDSDRNLVMVKGRLDPMLVKAIIVELGKDAEIVSYGRQPKNNWEHFEQQPKNVQSEFTSGTRNTAYQKWHKDCTCQDCNGHKMEENVHGFQDQRSGHGHKMEDDFHRFHDRVHQPSHNMEEKFHRFQDHIHRPGHNMEDNFHRFQDHLHQQSHKMEENFRRFQNDYPPDVDEHICRDEHCKIHHPKNVYCDHMPRRESADFFGHFSPGNFHGTNARYHQRPGMHTPGWFRDDTYLQSPRRPPLPVHGFGSGRPMHPYNDIFNTFSDENTRSCTIM